MTAKRVKKRMWHIESGPATFDERDKDKIHTFTIEDDVSHRIDAQITIKQMSSFSGNWFFFQGIAQINGKFVHVIGHYKAEFKDGYLFEE